ncbi:ABC transporter ATP-binding protein [Caldalkalibacillus mannanilyticus]|uniref:ABC transporter ATP-binding protein n=1 Tax=Caldalkalibacillus mannanilyticus TaxID=1418 RepID=UPI0004694D5A|nr:ABC transporter ATP-binding protein [Caldalkalibacillus mannanilyticus]
MTKNQKTKLQRWKSDFWMIAYLKPYRGWIIIGILSTLTIACLEIGIGLFIEQLTDYAVAGDYEHVLKTSGWLLLSILIGFAGKYLMEYTPARTSALATKDIRNRIVQHIGKLPISSIEKQHSGDIVSRITNDLHIIDEFIKKQFMKWFYQPVVFFGAFIYLLTINWKLLVFSILLIPFGMVVSHWVAKPLEKLADEAQLHMGKTNAVLQDTLGGIALVKAYQLQDNFLGSYRSFLHMEIQKKLQMEKRELLILPIMFSIMYSPIIFSIVFGSYLISTGSLDAAGLVVFVYLIFLVIEPISEIPDMITQLFAVKGASKRIAEVLNQPVEQQRDVQMKVNSKVDPIQFNHVRFSYQEGTAPVIKDLHGSVHEGETIALVGASGGGKSTIFKLLCGFYPMKTGEGDITIFGQSIRDWNLDQLRSSLSLVTQDSYLFAGSIYDNIAYGREGATKEEVIEVAKIANAHSFILDLPEGYQTEVGERGAGLSGGQRQRIAIARALLKDAPILLLDEPTSALDTESELVVQEALTTLMKERTTLVIAHRLTTIQNADQIWVLDDGKVVEAGNHTSLLEQKGLYARLYYKQFEDAYLDKGLVRQ